MDLRAILVNLDVDYYTPRLLNAAVDLADRFGAQLSAVAAATPPADLIAVEGTAVNVGAYEAARALLEERLQGLEVEFSESVPPRLRGRCVTLLESPTRVVAEIARRADLVVVSATKGEYAFSRNLNLGSLLLTAGRPVLTLATETAAIKARHIVVGWKDGRAARRAVADAMPLLKSAQDVLVAAIDEGAPLEQKASLEDLVAWLQLHGVNVKGELLPQDGTHAETLTGIATRVGADLLVTGAYSHNRMREQVFGGVTHDLLAATRFNRFMSN